TTVNGLFAQAEWIARYKNSPQCQGIPIFEVSEIEMSRISSLKTPSPVLALLPLPKNQITATPTQALLVDTLQDPGNMGTILRIADWFGIQHVYLFGACADPFQPKCIQSSMASFLRVQTIPISSIDAVEALPFEHRFAATLHGSPIDAHFIHQPGLLMIGNESKGLHPQLQSLCTHAITIPRVGQAESLNAAVATGILCHAWIC
ncbi:MAG: RNA methyltransferase, partial [Chitinophagaceae bacterium]|nr:RNA methyltransferase [Chitinophagaceae bacterium]